MAEVLGKKRSYPCDDEENQRKQNGTKPLRYVGQYVAEPDSKVFILLTVGVDVS